jgi:hypothetical protein
MVAPIVEEVIAASSWVTYAEAVIGAANRIAARTLKAARLNFVVILHPSVWLKIARFRAAIV